MKQGQSFEYISENRLFTDRDDFSMNIDLPLRGCRENTAIFGFIRRKDVDVNNIYFKAEIVDGNFHKSGAVVIVSITDEMARVQFLEGRSYQNFYPDFDNQYINELDLGGWSESITGITPAQMWGNTDVIALPWVNSYSGNIQNRADYNNGTWAWHTTADDNEDTEVVHGISCQIRLYKLTQLICEALGYTLNAQQWVNSEWYHLYSMNTVPEAWNTPYWKNTLPHWSINEFFNQLEKLMLCEFDINHEKRTVTFSFSIDNAVTAGEESIENIIDEYTHTVTKEDESKYKGLRNIGYEHCDHEMWNWYSCYWLWKERHFTGKGQHYDTLAQMLQALPDRISRGAHRVPQGNSDYTNMPVALLYAEDVDTSFALYEIARVDLESNISNYDIYGSVYKLLPVNRFGDRIYDEENWESVEEIRIVPAWLDEAINADNSTKGVVTFLPLGGLDNTSASGNVTHGRRPGAETVNPAVVTQANLIAAQAIINGKSSDKSSYNTIYVGFWYGEYTVFPTGKLPHPWIDPFEIDWGFTLTQVNNNLSGATLQITQSFAQYASGHNGSLRINNGNYGIGTQIERIVNIDTKHKYEFEFLSNYMPNTRAVFYIRGKKYLCSDIKADIDENGMSKKKKGTFYRIVDSNQNLPPYTSKIEYLQSTGHQYIDTGYTGGLNTKIYIKTMPLDSTCWLGGSRGSNTNSITLYKSTSSSNQRFGNKYVSTTYTNNTLYEITIDKTACIINGTSLAMNTTTSFTTPTNIYIMWAGSSTYGTNRCYGFKMWNGSTLVRDMIPVRIGGIGYMYDQVSGELFGNAGTGNFVLGPDIL